MVVKEAEEFDNLLPANKADHGNMHEGLKAKAALAGAQGGGGSGGGGEQGGVGKGSRGRGVGKGGLEGGGVPYLTGIRLKDMLHQRDPVGNPGVFLLNGRVTAIGNADAMIYQRHIEALHTRTSAAACNAFQLDLA